MAYNSQSFREGDTGYRQDRYQQHVPRSGYPANIQIQDPQATDTEMPDYRQSAQGGYWNEQDLDLVNVPETLKTVEDMNDIGRFIRPKHDQPWDPQMVTHGRLAITPVRMPQIRSDPGAGDFQIRPGPASGYMSDVKSVKTGCTTEDSGYKSQPTTAGGNAGFQFNYNQSPLHQYPFPSSAARGSARTEPQPNNKRSRASGSLQLEVPRRGLRASKTVLPKCFCGHTPKNPSDQKKHQNQHLKPFHCPEQDCNRKEGFATPNDLERHRKSVHGVEPRVGSKDCYFCAAAGCADKHKPWPRLDNFKAHIKRRHQDVDAAFLIERSRSTIGSDAGSNNGGRSRAQSCYSAEDATPSLAPSEDQQSQLDLLSPASAYGRSRHQSYQGDCDFLSPSLEAVDQGNSLLADLGSGLADTSLETRHEDAEYSMAEPDATYNNFHAVATMAAAMSPTDHHMFSSRHASFSTRSPNQARPSGFGFPSPVSAQPNQSTSQSCQGMVPQHSATAAGPDGKYTCSVCGKPKTRECDLKKHMKRHTRPYGCTFPKCSKTFGSRNDWKRHENSQHFQEEMWRCDLEPCVSRSPARLFYDKNEFAKHLKGIRHGMSSINETQLEQNLQRRHIGREGNKHFWCGFCTRLMSTEELHQQDPSLGVWDLRFKHVGDHFDKDGKHINGWLCVEMNKLKKDISKQDRQQARKQQRHPKTDDGDASDLGDSGIPDIPGHDAFLGQSFHGNGSYELPNKKRIGAGVECASPSFQLSYDPSWQH